MKINKLLVPLLFTPIVGLHAAEPGQKPNIIFVLFDDMGWGQPQCYNPESALRTPNLDKFVAQGMQFTDAHSAAAVCTPTRYGILTGRYPSRIGQFGVLTTYSKPIIPENRLTVASMLKQNGYATACIGKWHLGMIWANKSLSNEKEVPIGEKISGGPNDLGFDYFYGFTHARNIGSVIENDRVVAHVQPVENQPMMIKKAIKWIDEQSKKGGPFFLYYPMCPPHEPLVPDKEYIGKSGAKDLVKNSPLYGDWLFQGDAMLGQLLESIKKCGIEENTIVIVASDNGAEQRAYKPLRESKRSIYEGGHRVPFIVRWPGKVQSGSVNNHTICLNDFMATAAEIVGAHLPENAAEDSRSILSELNGMAKVAVHEATVHQSAYGDLAIRQGKWKLIFLKDGQHELYNIDKDLSETADVISQNTEIATKLSTLMQSYIDKGRSTMGKPQKNEFKLTLSGMAKKEKTQSLPSPANRQ